MTTAQAPLANSSHTQRTAVRLLLALTCGYAASTTVVVKAQSSQPALAILAPTPSQEISGRVSLWAGADFAAGLVSLRFRVDGKDLGQPITPGLNRITWDSTKATDGPHTVQAVGQDRFGNTIVSPAVTFFVNNFAPSAAPAQAPAPPPAAPPEPSLPPPPITAPGPAPAPRPKQNFGSDPRAVRAAAPVAVSCQEPDPFKSQGAIGLCVGGEWVLLWKPIKKA